MNLQWVLLLVSLVTCSSGEYQDNVVINEQNDPYKPYVWKVLDVLKLSTERNFDYNYGKIIEFTKKDENLYDITFDVEATCLVDTEQCSTKVLRCNGSVRYLTETNDLKASPDASCKDASVDNPVTEPTTTEEIVTEKIIKQPAPCLGCPEELNTNVAGIEPLLDSALFHVESERQQKHVILKILKVTRQVVAGVKYTLLLEIAPTTCSLYTFSSLTECPVDRSAEPEICEVTYYQRPWLSREKRIIANNCTQSQQFVTKNAHNFDADRYENVEKETVGTQRQMTEDRWASLLSQIIPDNKDDEQRVAVENKPDTNNNEGAAIKTTSEHCDEENNSESVSNLESSDSTPVILLNRKKRAADSSSSSSSSSDDDDDDNNNDDNENDHHDKHDKKKHKKASEKNIKKKEKDDKNDDTSSSSSSSSSDDDNDNKRNRRDIESALLDEFISTLNYGVYKHSLHKIIKTKELDLEIPYYFVQALVTMSKCDDDACNPVEEKFCKIKIKQDELIKIACHSAKKVKSKNSIRFTRGIPGAPVDAKNDDKIDSLLKTTMLQLDSASSHSNKYRLRLIDATRQVVSGIYYKIKAWLVLTDCSKNDTKEVNLCGELDEPKHEMCDISIWDRPWLPEGRKTNITCENSNFLFRARRKARINREEDFRDFIEKFKKEYKGENEYYYRMRIFSENLDKINDLNQNELGTAIYGVNQFADLSEDEFKNYKGLRTDLRNENDLDFIQAKIPKIDLPIEFDWRTKNVVTGVKNQGQCGSCWAFSVTGNVEGQYAIKNGKLLEFSEQELVDCDKLDEGCDGGLMDNAYRSIEKMGGLETENDYPYEAEDEKCQFNASLARVQLRGAVNISQDETEMAKWLVKNGPISIAINANAMQFYMGGVSHPLKFLCNPKSLDHGVLIVGYGEHKYPLFKKTLPYWIVKNSWGQSWGEQGYYRVYRGDGTCGVNQTPSSALL